MQTVIGEIEKRKELPDGMLEHGAEIFLNWCKDQSGIKAEPLEAFAKCGLFFAGCAARYKPEIYGKKWRDSRFVAPQKGLIIYGEVGRGKTTLMKLLYKALGRVLEADRICWYSDMDFQLEVSVRGSEFLNDFFLERKRSLMFFDDLGNEMAAKTFGNTFGGREIIRYRDECFQNYGSLTVMTTNLTPKSFESRYGAFAASRIYGGYEGVWVDYDSDRRRG